MQTLRLEIRRSGESALITKDRLRVDVGAEFYVSVDPTDDAIARASQTLGDRTFNPDKLRDLIEGMGLFAKPEVQWKPVAIGPMAGSRYCVTNHGFVVQAPQPVNEMSLIPFETGKLLGMAK